MTAFNNAVEAKEFFISRIIAEAVRENAALSELEKRTLYFTETGSDAKQEYLDDVAKFEDQYDDQEYEQKIARLLKRALITTQHTQMNWESKMLTKPTGARTRSSAQGRSLHTHYDR